MNILGIVVFMSISVCYSQHDPVRDEFRCAMPCSRRGRSYEEIVGGSANITFPGDNPGDFPDDGIVTNRICWARSGPFFAFRGFNGSHLVYKCVKDTMYDPKRDLVVLYDNTYRFIEGSPSLCDICNGKFNIFAVLKGCEIIIKPDLGCNIPVVCPVKENWQVKCTGCEPSEADDDGLCCDQ